MNEHIAHIVRRISAVGAAAAVAVIVLHGAPASSSRYGTATAVGTHSCGASHTVKGGLGWDGYCPRPI